MKLAVGQIAITTDVAIETGTILYEPAVNTRITDIQFSNESETEDVTMNLVVEYLEDRLRLREKDFEIQAGKTLKVQLTNITIGDLERIVAYVSVSNVVSFVVNGFPISEEESTESPEDYTEEPVISKELIESVLTGVISSHSHAPSGITTVTIPSSFNGQTFYNTYFDYNVSDLSFTDCNFLGVCYIKNTGGTITHTNSKGGIVISNGSPVAGLVGWFGLDTGDF